MVEPAGIVTLEPLTGAEIEIVGLAAWTMVKVKLWLAVAMPPPARGAPFESVTTMV